MLKFEKICFSYDRNNTVLDDINIKIGEHEKIAVIGQNGSGKSTFFLICDGILTPDSGNIFLDGRKITRSKKDITFLRKNVGIVFQEPDSQIIAGNVMAEISFGVLNITSDKKEAELKCRKAMKEMHLNGFEMRAPHLLSGGEKKRICIADVLAMEPKIILLDEPAASLDCKNADALEDTLNKLSKKNISVIVSTHDMDFAYKWAERVIVFNEGRIIADSTPENIFSDEKLCQQTSLKKPFALELSEILKDKGMLNKSLYPKTPEEFKKMIGE